MPPCRSGNGFKRKCKQCHTVNSLKKKKCPCGYDFEIERREKRQGQIQKRVEQGRKNRKGNNSTRLITRAMETLALYHGFGYEALFIYHTNSRRSETHLLHHESTENSTSRFAKSPHADKYKKIYANWIKLDKQSSGSSASSSQPTTNKRVGGKLATRSETISRAPDDEPSSNEQGDEDDQTAGIQVTNPVPDDQRGPQRQDNEDGQTSASNEEEAYHIDIADIERATGVNFATLENPGEDANDEDEQKQRVFKSPLGIREGKKVEAEDALNDLVCCATITEVRGCRMKVHFDGWTPDYDFWTKIGSSKVHFIGWCEEAQIPLCPPKDWADISSFTWERYLEMTGAEPLTLADIQHEEQKLARKRLSRKNERKNEKNSANAV